MATYILFLILLPLLTAFLIPLVDLINNHLRKVLVLLAVLAEVLLTVLLLLENYSSLQAGDFFLYYNLGAWKPPFGITLVMDSLSLFFSTLVTLALFLIIIYSIGFIGHHEGKYYVLIFLVLGAMQGAIISGDLFNLYVFIELLTITSAPLVAFKRNQNSTEAAIKYVLYGVIGGLFFFIGVILVYFNLGTLNMAWIANKFPEINTNLRYLISSFFLLSLLIKLGVFPFHFWLPKAHSACPSSISALLSGVLLKVYLYIFLRLFWIVLDFPLLEVTGLSQFMIYLALFSSILGHFFALQENDIKRMLAFSTIGHIGMILAAFLLNTKMGFYGGLLHVVSHLLMKASLFTATGYLLQYTPSHQIKDFNGVARKNKLIFVNFITAALGMIGIPPLIGFFSKWYILLAFLEKNNYLGAFLVILGSLIAVIYYLRYVAHGYAEQEIIQPAKERVVLKYFYREKLVTAVVYIFTILLVIGGLFFKVFDLPINAVIQDLINPLKYSQFFVGV